MNPFHGNIEELTLANKYFRKVLSTQAHCQLVVMCLQPNEDIGMETHPDNDQFIRVEKGTGRAVIGGQEYSLSDGVSVIVPAGTEHNIINDSTGYVMQLYTVYSPAHHPDGTVHETKEEAMKAEAEE